MTYKVIQLVLGGFVLGLSVVGAFTLNAVAPLVCIAVMFFAVGCIGDSIEWMLKDAKAEANDKLAVIYEANALKKVILLQDALCAAVKEEDYERAAKCLVLMEKLESCGVQDNGPTISLYPKP